MSSPSSATGSSPTAKPGSAATAPRTIQLGTLRELFIHDDWGRDKLMELAVGLSDEQLDRPFEMGEGSLRATLHHHWGAERSWLNRWRGIPRSQHAALFDEKHMAMTRLWELFRDTAAERDRYMSELTNADMTRTIAVTFSDGKSYTFALGDMMLHVCNHGVHHRAQAVNMARRLAAAATPPGLAVPKPGLDYIFMKLEEKPRPPAILDLGTIRAFQAYADWAAETVHAIAAGLSDAQLDRPFEIGMGTLRKTLLHIRDAEHWWLQNWTGGPEHCLTRLAETTPIAELRRLFAETIAGRAQFMRELTEGDLKRMVTGKPRPDVVRQFPLGVTMLQLCCHGTLHRAQALNMLRHVGAAVPELDYLDCVHALSSCAFSGGTA